MMELKHKLALVTGGARRVGQALVQALAAEGAVPLIHYHHSEARARLLAADTGGVALQADLSVPGGGELLARQVLEQDGALGVWINNASSYERAPLLEGDEQLWLRTLQLSLVAPATCARLAAPAMVDGGVFVNISDLGARRPWSGHAHHCVAKAGLEMLTRCMALELGPRLRACGVAPGLVLPQPDMPAALQRRLEQRTPLARQGTPEDVARAVLFLLGHDFVNGTILTVDGGLDLG